MTEVERLQRMVDDMTMAAARSAIALLHSFGLSGQEAEELVNSAGQPPKLTIPTEPSRPKSDAIPISVLHPVPSVNIILVMFDRLVPIGATFGAIHVGRSTYHNVVVIGHMEDPQMYRCEYGVDLHS